MKTEINLILISPTLQTTTLYNNPQKRKNKIRFLNIPEKQAISYYNPQFPFPLTSFTEKKYKPQRFWMRRATTVLKRCTELHHSCKLHMYQCTILKGNHQPSSGFTCPCLLVTNEGRGERIRNSTSKTLKYID